jgi:replicative DNA helicase
MFNAPVPPQSIEYEQALLGAILIDSSAYDKVSWIREEDFYHPVHREVYRVIGALISKAEPVDVVTVHSRLGLVLEYQYLGELAERIATSANVVAYAKIVREKSVLRQMLALATDIQEKIYGDEERASALIEHAEYGLQKIAEGRNFPAGDFESLEPIVVREVERLERAYSDGDYKSLGLKTGFHDLDKMILELNPGDLIYIAGRPSMGKTAFATNIAENIASKYQQDVGIFSMEMEKKGLARRLISGAGDIDYRALSPGSVSDNQWEQISGALGKLCTLKIHVDDSSGLSIKDIKSRTRKLYRECKGNLRLLVIDYIQLSEAERRSDNRNQELTEISKGLKALAKELGIAVIAISQLNRELEKRVDKRPIMADLRDSGALEQDADLILFVYRDEFYNKESASKGTAEIIVGKQRNGPIGTVRLRFKGEFSRFETIAGEDGGQVEVVETCSDGGFLELAR